MKIKSSKTLSSSRGGRKSVRRFFLYIIGAILSTHTILLVFVLTRNVNMSQTRVFSSLRSEMGKNTSNVNVSTAATITTTLNPQPVQSNPEKDVIMGLEGNRGTQRLPAAILNSPFAAALDPLPPNQKNVSMCVNPIFRDTGGPLSALASFPGSGNTWIRYLLQQASGFLTGSIYTDYSLLRNGFPAESVANSSVIIVKIHECGSGMRKPFNRAVLLIRNPFKTFLAEFNRRAAGHLGHAPPDRFLKGKGWQEYVTTQVKAWSQFILDWLNFSGPLIILRYEDVVNDLPNQLRRLMSFLNVTVRPQLLQCALKNREGIFRRPTRLLPFDPFSVVVGGISLRKYVEKHRVMVYSAVKRFEESETYKETLRQFVNFEPPPSTTATEPENERKDNNSDDISGLSSNPNINEVPMY